MPQGTQHFHPSLKSFFLWVYPSFSPAIRLCSGLPASVVAHHQKLNHSDEDVQEIELEGNRLINWIRLNKAALSETSVMQNLLDIVQSEATENGKTTIEPDVLSEGESADSSSWQYEWCKAGNSNDGDTSQKWSTEIEIFVGLSGSSDEGDGAHHSDSVETGAGHDSRWSHEHQRRNEHSLCSIESSPKSVLLDVVRWVGSTSAIHSSETEGESTDHNNPRVRRHKSIHKAGGIHSARRNTNDSNTQPGVHERLVQVCALERRHTSIFTRLAVEHEVDGQKCAAEDCAAVDETLHQVSLCGWESGLLNIVGARLTKDSLKERIGLERRSGGAGGEESIAFGGGVKGSCWDLGADRGFGEGVESA